VQIGMIGLGRMGANMARRLEKFGHHCVVYDPSESAVRSLTETGATAAASPVDMLSKLSAPRVVWIMIPAGAVDALLGTLQPALRASDIVIDGGNSHYVDDIRRAQQLAPLGVRYLDVGTSGGLWGLERGYCLMIGGDTQAVQQVEPVLAALSSDAKAGAGHFVKMIHNGIEYGLMAAYAEGFNILHKIGAGAGQTVIDAETAPTQQITHGYEFKLDQIAELWRHGSVVSSWLLDLLAGQLATNVGLDEFAGHVADSGEGRWTVQTAVDAGVPVPVLATALFARYTSRGEADFANRILSAMRLGFGGHQERASARA